MHPVLRLAARCLLALLVLVAAAYCVEDLMVRYRVSHKQAASLFSEVPVYQAGEVKGGRVEYYFDQPRTETCLHTVFPHLGVAPCWYVTRHALQQVAEAQPTRH